MGGHTDYKIKYYTDKLNVANYSDFVLGGDVSGTNTNFGIAGIRDKNLDLLFSTHFKTQKILSLVDVINETLEYAKRKHKIRITDSFFGVSGPVSLDHSFCRLINAKMDISVKEILEKSALKKTYLVNDFEIIGYGINMLDIKNPEDILIIKDKPGKRNHAPKAILGAGTGLGKCILIYDESKKDYTPFPSGGGHVDFPVQNELELELSNFIKKQENFSGVGYEELVSGRGIANIYSFLLNTKKFNETAYTNAILKAKDKSPLISKFRKKDSICSETFRLFAKYYARCARNFVLDTMARGGLYITGGIASKNQEIFQTRDFIQEFETPYCPAKALILKETPIYLIVNYNVSLLGACFAAMKLKQD